MPTAAVLATALKMVDEGCIGYVKGLVAQEPTTVHPDVVPENLKPQYTSYEEFSDYTVDSKPAMLAFYGMLSASL